MKEKRLGLCVCVPIVDSSSQRCNEKFTRRFAEFLAIVVDVVSKSRQRFVAQFIQNATHNLFLCFIHKYLKANFLWVRPQALGN